MARTKKPVNEKMAIAQAEKAAEDMGGSAGLSCRSAIDGVREAAQWMGRAQARLSDGHPALRELFKTYFRRFDQIRDRCGGK